MQITHKALISIVVCLVIILLGFGYYGTLRKNEPDPAVTITLPVVPTNEITDSLWVWEHTLLPDGSKELAPNTKFILSFDPLTKSMTSTTDCNMLSSNYIKDGEIISFAPFGSTKMYCEGSKDAEYGKMLGLTTSYTLSSNELRFNLNRDAGVMVFIKKQPQITSTSSHDILTK